MKHRLVLTLLIWASLFSFADAAVIVSNTTGTDRGIYDHREGNAHIGMWLGSGADIPYWLTGASFKMDAGTSTGSWGVRAELIECPTPSFLACAPSQAQFPRVATSTITTIQADYPSSETWVANFIEPYHVNPDKYYAIVIYTTAGASWGGVWYENGVDIIPSMHATSSIYNGTTIFDGSEDLYFELRGTFDEQGFDTSSRITSVNSPDQGEITETSLVYFDFDYYNNPSNGYDTARIEITDLTTAYTYAPVDSPILGSGEQSFRDYVSLPENHMFMWRACLVNASSLNKKCSHTYVFYTVQNVAGQSLIPIVNVNDNNASSTLSALAGTAYRLINILGTKFPFNWMTEFIVAVNNATSNQSQEALIVFDFSQVSSTSAMIMPEPIVVFSSSTVSHFMPDGFIDTIRTLLVATLWLGFASYVFFWIRNSHAV